MFFANTACLISAIFSPSTLSGFPTLSGCLLNTTTRCTQHGVAPHERVNRQEPLLSRRC